MNLIIYGSVSFLFGSLYPWRPTIFRRGIWMKTSIAIRTLSETNYTRYMRGLGGVLIVVGMTLMVAGVLNLSKPS